MTNSSDPVEPAGTSPAPQNAGAPALNETMVWDALRQCFDPEIPVNIVDLGMVYDVAIQGNRIDVKMTLTAQGCPMAGMIAGDAQSKLMAIQGVESANVEIVWDPPWHPSMITAEGKKILGME